MWKEITQSEPLLGCKILWLSLRSLQRSTHRPIGRRFLLQAGIQTTHNLPRGSCRGFQLFLWLCARLSSGCEPVEMVKKEQKKKPPMGIEPMTFCLRGRRTATMLRRLSVESLFLFTNYQGKQPSFCCARLIGRFHFWFENKIVMGLMSKSFAFQDSELILEPSSLFSKCKPGSSYWVMNQINPLLFERIYRVSLHKINFLLVFFLPSNLIVFP